jgi:alpha-mannosidase
MSELAKSPDRRFNYVEQAFFQRWWNDADPVAQQQVRGFVASGQLKFINGGWCMHDEANPDFVSMIDQTTLGHRFLRDEFGVFPTTQWQIDVSCALAIRSSTGRSIQLRTMRSTSLCIRSRKASPARS